MLPKNVTIPLVNGWNEGSQSPSEIPTKCPFQQKSRESASWQTTPFLLTMSIHNADVCMHTSAHTSCTSSRTRIPGSRKWSTFRPLRMESRHPLLARGYPAEKVRLCHTPLVSEPLSPRELCAHQLWWPGMLKCWDYSLPPAPPQFSRRVSQSPLCMMASLPTAGGCQALKTSPCRTGLESHCTMKSIKLLIAFVGLHGGKKTLSIFPFLFFVLRQII